MFSSQSKRGTQNILDLGSSILKWVVYPCYHLHALLMLCLLGQFTCVKFRGLGHSDAHLSLEMCPLNGSVSLDDSVCLLGFVLFCFSFGPETHQCI